MVINLTEAEVQNILVALSKFPYFEVAELINKISAQTKKPDEVPPA